MSRDTAKQLPAIAVVVSGFPVLSQTFVSLQIAELYKKYPGIIVVNAGRQETAHQAPRALREIMDQITTVTLPGARLPFPFSKIIALIPALVYAACVKPLPFLRLLAGTCKHGRISTLLITVHDAYLFRSLSDVDIIHCQFLHLTLRLSRVISAGLFKTTAHIASSVRGFDITAQDSINKITKSPVFYHGDLFLPVCDYFVSILRDLGCTKPVTVVHSPVNIASLTPLLHDTPMHDTSERDRHIRIVSVGRLVDKKGIDTALEAIARLQEKYNDFTYTIIGTGPLLRPLRKLVAALHLTGKVVFAGALPPDKTLLKVASSHILLAPSRTGADGNMEGIPNVIKEAMFLGVAVTSTRHAGIPELVEDGIDGYLVDENAPGQLASLLYKLCTRYVREGSFGLDTGRMREKIIQTFSPESTTEALVDAYRFMLKEDR